MGRIEVRFYKDHKYEDAIIYVTNFVPRIGEEIWYKSNYYTVESATYEEYLKDPILEEKSEKGLDVYIRAAL